VSGPSPDGLFSDLDRDLGEILEEVARLSVRLVLQSALEAEATEFLGRERYARRERARVGHHNGYSPLAVTTAGPVRLERP
jgi:putative transposase